MTVEAAPTYRLWINDDRTVLFRLWTTGEAEVAVRDHESQLWGPPIRVVEEPPQW